jgi:hypothetical protein
MFHSKLFPITALLKESFMTFTPHHLPFLRSYDKIRKSIMNSRTTYLRHMAFALLHEVAALLFCSEEFPSYGILILGISNTQSRSTADVSFYFSFLGHLRQEAGTDIWAADEVSRLFSPPVSVFLTLSDRRVGLLCSI